MIVNEIVKIHSQIQINHTEKFQREIKHDVYRKWQKCLPSFGF